MSNAKYEKNKFGEMIKYICAKSANDKYFGETKLYKILFFCDFLAYRDIGQAVSGEGYHKENHGPVPHHARKVIKKLLQNGELGKLTPLLGGYAQNRYVTLKPYDLSIFSPQEVSLIDNVIESLEGASATEVSDLSHRFVGWELAAMGEDIPYEVVLLEEGTVTENDIEYGQKLLREMEKTATVR